MGWARYHVRWSCAWQIRGGGSGYCHRKRQERGEKERKSAFLRLHLLASKLFKVAVVFDLLVLVWTQYFSCDHGWNGSRMEPCIMKLGCRRGFPVHGPSKNFVIRLFGVLATCDIYVSFIVIFIFFPPLVFRKDEATKVTTMAVCIS